MFGFIKPKKSAPTPAMAGKTSTLSYSSIRGPGKPNLPVSAKHVDVIFLSECFARALQGLRQNGKFQGAFANDPRFKCMMTPDGIEVAGSEEMQTAVVLAENVMNISTVGATPMHWSHIAVAVHCKHTIGIEPDWEDFDGVLKSSLAAGPTLEFHFTAQGADSIDPVWSGQKLAGATLTIEVKAKPPLGGTH
ncbi:MAG: hypothetical protein AAF222_03030 [Pseudomonadota bacterium]